MRRLEKLGKVIGTIGIIIAVIGAIQSIGTLDIENYMDYSLKFLWISFLAGVVIFLIGCGLIKTSEYLKDLSKKAYVKVWIRNTRNNKIRVKFVEKGSNVKLSYKEEIFRVGKRVYYFR